MFKTILSAAYVLLSLSALAQFSVTGYVRDKKTKEPLPGASVLLSDGNKANVADQNGRFVFENVAAGTHQLKVTFMGYREANETVTISSGREINFYLEQSAILTEAVVVSATRANDKTPTTHVTLNKDEIKEKNFGQDLPFLLNWTPSVVTTSDAGTGIGYTGIRIRGSDGTRINVTINGIPYNDSESLGAFWVDIPDIASSTESIQIQRGVGTSTNGASAFGATINLQTNERNETPYAEVVNSFGSFNTRRHTLSFGSGILNNHWVIDGRISKIKSDGFIDRASADLNSYYFSAGFYSGNTMLKAIMFGGKERTYQSWWGVPESRLNNDTEAMLTTASNEGWNELQINNLLNSNGRTFNPYLYKNQVDDYRQDHYQLHFSQQFGDALTWNTAVHFTPGRGYYEEYRFDDDFENYGIPPVVIGDSVIESSDLIRRRWLDNNFYGFTYSLNYDKNYWNIIFGGGWNRYDGDHFGEILWAEVATVPAEYRYYFNNGDKRDFNSYIKLNYQLSQKLSAFADLQYRKIGYTVEGIENEQNELDVNADFNFFNPKGGLTWAIDDRNQLYGSYAVANREPVRNDFVDFPGDKPKHETLHNLELGYRGTGSRHMLHLNYYLMNYTNQLVLTGQVNDVGAFVRTNAGSSYRMGVELQGAIKLTDRWQWDANVTFSRNKIDEYVEVLTDYGPTFEDEVVVERKFTDTDIAFSPNVIAGSSLRFIPVKNGEIALMSKYVGRQYLDNTQNTNRSIDPYFMNDLRLSYAWKPSFIKQVDFSFMFNNIFDVKYESNGYTWGYMGGGVEYRENYFYPQAGRNFMAMIAVRF